MYQIAVYEYRGGPLLYDFSHTANGPKFQTNKYGFGLLTFSVNKRFDENAKIYRYKKIAHVEINLGAKKIYEGRLEDIEFTDQELNIVSYGYIRAFTDIQCTDLWSSTQYENWFIGTPLNSLSVYDDTKHIQDNTNRLYIGLKNNTTYGTSPSIRGGWIINNKSGSLRPITTLQFNVSGSLSNSFVSRITTRDESDYSNGVVDASLQNTGSSIFTSVNVTQGLDRLVFFEYLRNNTNALFSGEDGSQGYQLSNIRFGTTTSISGSRLYADEILKYVLSGVNTLNSLQLSTSINNIQSPLTDITDFEYEDITGLDVINLLLQKPDNSNRLWECKVFFDGVVKFQPRGYDAKTWYVDVGEFKVSKNFDKISNKVRVKNGDDRTTFLLNNTSISDYGITRESTGSISDGSSTEANLLRAALLSDMADNQVQSTIETKWIRDSNRAIRSSIDVRSGDTIIIGNLPPNLFEETLTTFTVLETEYDLETGVCTIVPDQNNPEMEILLSKISY